MTLLVIGLVLSWLLCSAISYAGSFGYWQNEYPEDAAGRYSHDMWFSVGISFAGPLSLLIVFLNADYFRHGFKWN